MNARPAPTVEPMVVGGVAIPPGRTGTVELRVARLPTGTWMSLSTRVVHGRHPGPALWLSGAVHGDELNGIEIIRRVLRMLDPRHLAGTVIAVPIVNVFGFIGESRYLPDRRDLNRQFPGSPRGSLAGRLADLFMREVVLKCQYGLDLHTGADHRINLPQIRADLSDDETRRMAFAFGAPVAIDSPNRDGSLRAEARAQGRHVLVYEGGGTNRFDDDAIAVGTEGVLRVLDVLGMKPHPIERATEPTLEVTRTQWIRARGSGLFRPHARLGDLVGAGAAVGVVSDAFGDVNNLVRAPFAGMIIGLAMQPLVSQGDPLVNLADRSSAGLPPRPERPLTRPYR